MPIRSARGRAGAYRVIWQWPLRSPGRLALTVVVLGLVVLGLVFLGGKVGGGAAGGGLLAGGSGQDAQRWDSGGSGVSATPTPTPTPTMLPPVAPLTPARLPLDQAPPQALEAARVWTSAWVNHPEGITTQQWMAGLRPYTTDEFLGVLAGVDPAKVPASRVTGRAVPTRVSPKSVEAIVPTDTLRLSVLVVETDVGWRVSRYERA